MRELALRYLTSGRIQVSDVWIMGYGGIGKALHELFNNNGFEVKIFSSKTHSDLDYSQVIDLTSEKQVCKLFEGVDSLPDIIINTCGVLHSKSKQPEKSIAQFNHDWFLKSIDINVLTNVWLLKEVTKKLTRKMDLVYCAFSARVSSISDNRLGGWYSYRMTKSMLNMLVKNTSLEWNLKAPKAKIFSYHPGTVDTPLSLPFQKRLNPEQLFSTETAADYFYKVLQTLKKEHHGEIMDWQGKIICP